MLHEEVKQLCINELNGLSKYDCSDVDRLQLFNEICQKISGAYELEGLQIERSTRGTNDCIIYRFKGYNDAVCSAGFLYNQDTFDDDLAKAICDIIDGKEAIKIINDIIDENHDKYGDATEVYFIWGKGPFCRVYDWDYDRISFKLSNNALKNILEKYRDGATSFSIGISNILSENRITNDNILGIIANFNEYQISKYIDAELGNKGLINHLSSCLISRNEAIDICEKQPKNSIVNLKVVEIIHQLGTFIALANWRIDLQNKKSTVSLIGDRVIDADKAEFVSNYSICSRIEQTIGLSDEEIDRIFAN